jgi:hypothetical protein
VDRVAGELGVPPHLYNDPAAREVMGWYETYKEDPLAPKLSFEEARSAMKFAKGPDPDGFDIRLKGSDVGHADPVREPEPSPTVNTGNEVEPTGHVPESPEDFARRFGETPPDRDGLSPPVDTVAPGESYDVPETDESRLSKATAEPDVTAEAPESTVEPEVEPAAPPAAHDEPEIEVRLPTDAGEDRAGARDARGGRRGAGRDRGGAARSGHQGGERGQGGDQGAGRPAGHLLPPADNTIYIDPRNNPDVNDILPHELDHVPKFAEILKTSKDPVELSERLARMEAEAETERILNGREREGAGSDERMRAEVERHKQKLVDDAREQFPDASDGDLRSTAERAFRERAAQMPADVVYQAAYDDALKWAKLDGLDGAEADARGAVGGHRDPRRDLGPAQGQQGAHLPGCLERHGRQPPRRDRFRGAHGGRCAAGAAGAGEVAGGRAGRRAVGGQQDGARVSPDHAGLLARGARRSNGEEGLQPEEHRQRAQEQGVRLSGERGAGVGVRRRRHPERAHRHRRSGEAHHPRRHRRAGDHGHPGGVDPRLVSTDFSGCGATVVRGVDAKGNVVLLVGHVEQLGRSRSTGRASRPTSRPCAPRGVTDLQVVVVPGDPEKGATIRRAKATWSSATM